MGIGTLRLPAARRKRRVTGVVDHSYARILPRRRTETRSSRHRSANWRTCLSFLAMFSLLSAGTAGLAQAIPARRGPSGTMLQAASLVKTLGLTSSTDGTSLTIRSDNGVLTLFAGSPDVLWQASGATSPSEESLSAPAVIVDGEWWLPLDAATFLGLELVEGTLRGADHLSAPLEFSAPETVTGRSGELVELGQGVPGLRLYRSGSAGEATQSLLLADAGLLGLAMPEERSRFDRLVSDAGRDHALIMILTSVAAAEWDSVIGFSQGSLSVEVRHPFRLRLLRGDATLVTPDSPALAVILLPEQFNLRRPIVVRWGAASASIVFRR